MRLAIIDDHPLVFDALAVVIAEVAGHPEISGFARLEEYERAAESGQRFDLVLLDLTLPGFSGLESLRRYRMNESAAPVVVLSAVSDRNVIVQALDLGAMGFIPKSSRRDVLIGALQLVVVGGVYIPPEALKSAPDRAAQSRSVAGASYDANEDPPQRSWRGAELAGITQRQRDVLDLLLKGMSNKLICRELSLSPNTVKSHISAVFRALDVNNRTQAVLAAHRLGIRVAYQGHVSRIG
jgi:DNA-binding NarL/FixJ family response regulator